MSPVVMYDTVTLGVVPASPQAVAGYVGGSWPTYAGLVKDFPHARHVSIAVNAGEVADCLDVENGDATVGQAAAWFHRQTARGLKRPIIYTSISNAAALEQTLAAAGIARDAFLLWSAHYTLKPHICGPGCGFGNVTADATQWTDRAHELNLDESLCSDAFFGITVDPLKALEPAERKAVDELAELRATHPTWHPHHIAAEETEVVRLRKLVWHAAQDPHGWNILNRRARYAILLKASKPPA